LADTLKSDADERQVEDLARELARRLRGMNSRQELTDYAVAMLRESAEEANQEEQARESVQRAAKVGNINTIAFGLPLGIIGLVLCATGILAGPGLIILGAAGAMVAYGLVTALVFRPRKGSGGPAG
jgi:amino acid permease